MKFHKDGTLPAAGQVFVFGSNLMGIHGAGAARIAQSLGAVHGVGKGACGNTYAIPTKRTPSQTLALESIKTVVDEFKEYAAKCPDTEFFVTRIGCGLAGYHDSQIAPMFADAPDNCSFAHEWEKYLRKGLQS